LKNFEIRIIRINLDFVSPLNITDVIDSVKWGIRLIMTSLKLILILQLIH